MGPQEEDEKGPQEGQKGAQDAQGQGSQEEGFQEGVPQGGMGQEEEVARHKARKEVEHEAEEVEEEVAPGEGQEVQGQAHEEGECFCGRMSNCLA